MSQYPHPNAPGEFNNSPNAPPSYDGQQQYPPQQYPPQQGYVVTSSPYVATEERRRQRNNDNELLCGLALCAALCCIFNN
eukprot:m.52939 g.52939  ORF g.52939 m.52939 type:complete len:80 (-) comp11019_c0_seq2:2052-2291(-)